MLKNLDLEIGIYVSFTFVPLHYVVIELQINDIADLKKRNSAITKPVFYLEPLKWHSSGQHWHDTDKWTLS